MANGQVPRTDPFTFGSANRPWIDLQWLFEVILATVYKAGRVRAVVLMTAAVATSVLVVALMARDKRWPSWIVAACWVPALTAMSARFVPRPELFSLLGIAIYLTVLRRANTTPALAWLLPVVQVFWVNVHALFVLGPLILAAYLIERVVGPVFERAPARERATAEERRRWRFHVGGAAVAVVLACLANPYGLQGVLFPLELFPKITAWGGLYKSYIAEFADLREYIQNQGTELTAGNLYVEAACFLFWMVPVSLIVPAVWRNGGALGSGGAGSAQAAGWLVILGSATGLVLTSVLGLPGARTWGWLVRFAEMAPLGFLALGALGAALAVRASWLAMLLALIGGAAEGAWIIWLRLYLFGRETGLPTWLGTSDFSTFGYATLLLGAVTAALLLRGGERPFRMILAVVFGYLALQAVRNVNLFALAAGFVLAWSLGGWFADLRARLTVQQRHAASCSAAGLMARVSVLALIGVMIFMVVSGSFFHFTGGRGRFGTIESPSAYAHEAARFAGRPGLPDHALVFSLAQAGVYLYHNGPDRKPFLDGRLEVPTRATFESYVHLSQQLQGGGHGWADVLRRMGDPLILLDHESNIGGEATLLLDPEWRCVYYDPIASVFLSRRRRDLEAAFPSVDFTARHFRDRANRAIAPAPWGLGEAWGLHSLASTLRIRNAAVPGSTPSLQFALALLVSDRVRDALILDPANVRHWCLLGDSCWNMVGALRLTAPNPEDSWEPVRGLLPAQAAFCYQRALEINPRDTDAQRSLSFAFQALRLSDTQGSLDRRGDRSAWTTSDREATILLYRGRPAEARRLWERAIDPPSPALRLARIATADLAAMDFPAAKRSFRAALALDPSLVETWLGVALLHTQQGDPAEALTASREGLRRPLTPEQSSFLRFVEALTAPYASHR